MSGRIKSQLLVQALIRQVNAQGGFAVVIHKGDADTGAILVQIYAGSGRDICLFERIPDFSGGYRLERVATQYCDDPAALAQYIDRRLRSDPDLWIIELDVADGQQFAEEILTSD